MESETVEQKPQPQVPGQERSAVYFEGFKAGVQSTHEMYKIVLVSILKDLPQFRKEAPTQNDSEKPALKCPKCGKTDSVIKGKPEFGGGWLCYSKKNGCGEKWS